MAATGSVEEQVLAANVRLLQSIKDGDWATYTELCDSNISCFEPETKGFLVEGLPFHKYYFDMPGNPSAPARNTVLARPKVQLLAGGKVAIVTYNRLTQILGDTAVAQETRVWEQRDGKWVHVHFHKST